MNLTGFLTFKMVLLWAIAFAIFHAVKVKLIRKII